MGVNTKIAGGSGDFAFSVEDFAGSKALKVVPSGKVTCVGLQVDALLGEIDDVSESKIIKEDIAKTLTADIVISRLLPSIDNRQVINDDTYEGIKRKNS